MKNEFTNMTYEEFFNYCEERACDGQWDLNEAILCFGVIKHLQKIRVTTFIFYSKKKTRKAREDEWERIKNIFKEEK